MRALANVDVRRKQMLLELGRQGVLKGDLHRSLQASGVKEGIGAMRPDRFRPAMDASQTAMQKWVQAALNVVLGTRLKLDGNIGPVSRQALRRFQQQEGLTAHGYADEATLQALELRVGLSCPRGGFHEPVPSLLVLPMRGVWMPKPKGQKPKERGAEAGEREAAQGPAAGATAAASQEQAQRGPEAEVRDDVVQREALGAVRAMAFTDGFVERAAEWLEREDQPVVRAEMDRWLDRNLGTPADKAPDWLREVRGSARGNAASAASALRRSWWNEHVGEGEGL